MTNVTITSEILKDLLPAYLSGTASAATMQLVDDYLKEHPDFLETMDSRLESILGKKTRNGQVELKALERTRRMIRGRIWFKAFAIFFTLLPFSFEVGDKTGFRWLFADSPVTIGFFVFWAVVFWIGYFVMRGKVKVTDVV
ncbi:MAG: hypothetical protein GXO70_03975 [Acidobacteria bacterium]|nr:hypothetical protein [Acidobacteriota bacterium]